MTPGPERADPILDLLAGKARAQAVSTAASLGLADALADGPQPLDHLAATVDCVPERLRSLLRVLIGVGLFESTEPDVFAVTDLGRRLQRDQLGPLATALGSPAQWEPWGYLREAMRGGPNPFERRFQQTLYEFLASHPEDSASFDAGVDVYTRQEAAALCEAYDFDNAQTVVDIGGGRGTLLSEVVRHWKHLRGTLFDLPHVVDSVRSELATAAPGRIECTGGDFREGVPSGDVLLIKHVLHNWPDDTALEILKTCREALRADGHIIVLDALLTPDDRPDSASMLDLEMLTMTGGRERRKPEVRRLFHAAGLRIERFQQLTPSCWMILGAPAAAPDARE